MTPERVEFSQSRRMKDLEKQIVAIRRLLLLESITLLLLAANVLRITLR